MPVQPHTGRPELRGTRTGACALAILVPPVPATCAPLPAPVSPQSKPYRQQPPKKPDLRATGLSLSTVYGTEMIIFYDSTISDSTMSFCTDFQGDRMQHVFLHPTGVGGAPTGTHRLLSSNAGATSALVHVAANLLMFCDLRCRKAFCTPRV